MRIYIGQLEKQLTTIKGSQIGQNVAAPPEEKAGVEGAVEQEKPLKKRRGRKKKTE